ncbi:MAG: DUF945 family protein [Oceanospirillaceae bacterium]|nr:DUF945 family protein [Oceanospirillaceae bacterium]
MKKILAVLAFMLVAACLVAPKIIAPKHQEKLAEIVASINKATGYSAHIISTHSAWFGSENKVLVSYDISPLDTSGQSQKLETELLIITHYGPLLFSKQGIVGLYSTDIHISGEKERPILNWNKDLPLYQLSVLGDFNGNIKVADSIPKFTNPDNGIQFGGYSGQGEFKAQKFSYQGTLQQVDMTGRLPPIKVEDFTVSIDLDSDLDTLMSGGFYKSKTNFSLDRLSVGTNTELSGIKIKVGSDLDKETQLGTVTLDYYINHMTYGEIEVNDLAMLTELTNLSNRFFTDFKTFSNKVPVHVDSQESNYEQLLTFMQENIAELLAQKPQFNVTEFKGSFPEGNFTGNLSSHFANIQTPTLNELISPDFWLYNTVIKANIKVDEPLLRDLAEQFIANKMRAPKNAPQVKLQVQRLLQSLVDGGILKGPEKTVIQSDQYFYSSELLIKSGQARINDTPFPLM